MMINVFDDKRSLGHTVAGAVSLFIPFVFVFFIFYEIVEHLLLAGKEKEANFLGDIFEFLVGLGATALAVRMIL